MSSRRILSGVERLVGAGAGGGTIVVSILFGYGHRLGYRTLWTSILAHGFIDTFAVVIVYFGWAG